MKKIFILILLFKYLYSTDLQKVSLQLMWLDQFQFAGFYMAKERGFYEKAGLDVEFKKFNSTTNVLEEVIENRANFGISSSSLIIDRSNGKDIVLLGAIFQTSPLILLALENSDLNSLKDFKDKKLMITGEQLDFATFKAMFVSQNIDINSMKIIPHSFNIDDLINKNTDLMLSYTTNEPFLLKERGYGSKIFYPKDYGFDFYENFIFTNSKFVEKNPKLVYDFYKASIDGWKWTFENIEKSVDTIFKKYNPQNKTKEALLFEANEMKKLTFDKNGDIGTISNEKINLILNTYKVMGLIKNDIDLKSFVLHNSFQNELNSEEKEYLKTKKSFTYCSHNNLMPFEATLNNKHIGIIEEYLVEISKNLDIELNFVPTLNWHESFEKVVENKCDILTTIADKKNREKLFNFTNPYLDFPFVIATDISKPFIEDLKTLKRVKIALVKDFATSNIIKNRYKNINFVEYPNLYEALEAVRKGEVYAAIDSLAVIGYEIQNHFVGDIKVSGKIDENLKLYMATNIENKTLASILNKALNSINENQKHEFFNKWVYVNYQNSINKDTVLKLFILILAIFFIIAIIYRAYLLKKTNQELENRVAFEIKQNEEKNGILLQQSKMAAMGEMLENIAHQWRQPLSTISICTSGMELKKNLNMLEDKDFYDSINHIKSSISYLSNTIEDFRSFLDKDKVLSNVNINHLVQKVLDILNPSLQSHHIEVIKNIDDFEFVTIENDLIQILMNIITNAKDALKDLKDEEPRYIFINISKNQKNIVIEIFDNAMGIKDEIISRIFEPYFTTKHKSQGTGIGLYMSKILVDNNLKGTIFVENYKFSYNNIDYKGAKFNILLPINLDKK
ncbi:ABC transporter substrate-binding protein [Aliarcobacter cryaerophilus]|uniref:ABC transporter substrate-binding protein n=1 Tax=Aliarcobacter cryaerophilus TaxID=28198 RepID=UPI0021B59E14|nr:ABC transporter substrate-binding protein [Aliarcobacter cryaerophilus]MCT7481425.1 ABC transporter substrate-binding protein [Aliarcobacter cryaerophilus]